MVMHAAPTTEQRGTEGARVARGRRPARRGGAPNARLDAQLQQHQSEHRGRQVRRRVRQRERDLRCQAPSAAPAPRRVRTPVSPAMDRSTCTDQPSQQPILAPAAHGCDAGCIQWRLDTPYRSGCRRTGKHARVVHTAGSTRASAAARQGYARQQRRKTPPIGLAYPRIEQSYPTLPGYKPCLPSCAAARGAHRTASASASDCRRPGGGGGGGPGTAPTPPPRARPRQMANSTPSAASDTRDSLKIAPTASAPAQASAAAASRAVCASSTAANRWQRGSTLTCGARAALAPAAAPHSNVGHFLLCSTEGSQGWAVTGRRPGGLYVEWIWPAALLEAQTMVPRWWVAQSLPAARRFAAQRVER